jgi:hypothetical protein
LLHAVAGRFDARVLKSTRDVKPGHVIGTDSGVLDGHHLRGPPEDGERKIARPRAVGIHVKRRVGVRAEMHAHPKGPEIHVTSRFDLRRALQLERHVAGPRGCFFVEGLGNGNHKLDWYLRNPPACGMVEAA